MAFAITGYFFKTMTEWVFARRYFPVPTTILQMGDTFYHLVGLAAGLAVFLALMLNGRSKVFVEEVAIETSKVTWPTTKETVNAAIVVSIAVVIAGFVLFFLDMMLGSALRWSLNTIIQ